MKRYILSLLFISLNLTSMDKPMEVDTTNRDIARAVVSAPRPDTARPATDNRVPSHSLMIQLRENDIFGELFITIFDFLKLTNPSYNDLREMFDSYSPALKIKDDLNGTIQLLEKKKALNEDVQDCDNRLKKCYERSQKLRNFIKLFLSFFNCQGNYNSELRKAINTYDIHRVFILLMANANPNSKDFNGITPYMEALDLEEKLEKGRKIQELQIIRFIIPLLEEAGAYKIQKNSPKFNSALSINRANFNMLHKAAMHGTPSDIEAICKDMTTEQLSAKTTDVKGTLSQENIQIIQNWNALFFALSCGRKDNFNTLIQILSARLNVGELKRIVNHADIKGKTLLHLASERGYDDICQTLINFGANVNTKDQLGVNPLGYAMLVSSQAKNKTIACLLKNGAENIAIDISIAEKIIGV